MAAGSERWLEVEDYRSRKGSGELVLRARGKRLWFPMSEPAYREFKDRLRGSQHDALRFAKAHVRSPGKVKEPYGGKWGGARSRYYRRNKLPLFGRKKRLDVGDARREFEMDKQSLAAYLDEMEKLSMLLPLLGAAGVTGGAALLMAKKLRKKIYNSRMPGERPIQYGKF